MRLIRQFETEFEARVVGLGLNDVPEDLVLALGYRVSGSARGLVRIQLPTSGVVEDGGGVICRPRGVWSYSLSPREVNWPGVVAVIPIGAEPFAINVVSDLEIELSPNAGDVWFTTQHDQPGLDELASGFGWVRMPGETDAQLRDRRAAAAPDTHVAPQHATRDS